jgi:hypothetical protein
MNLRLLSGVLLLALALVLVSAPEPAGACAPAPPHNVPVAIASESAIIVWDEMNHIQHFIRRAAFTTEAKDFGFLVPTPTKPELAEADDVSFETLARITAPEEVTKKREPSPGCGIGCAAAKHAAGDADQARLSVLEEKRVAGYDAAVLEGNDASLLANWLKARGYDFSEPLHGWVEPYLKGGWKITAFKVAKKGSQEPSVATSAVRMTFKTPRPFFPYKEPANPEKGGPNQLHPQRLLRVFFVGAEKVQGTLGEKGEAWPGKAAWAGELKAEDRTLLLQELKLPANTQPAKWWLTEFEDHSSPRPGSADVYFARAADQDAVKRPPHIKYVSSAMPGCVMCWAVAAYLVIPCLVRQWRRRSEAAGLARRAEPTERRNAAG